MASGNTLCAFGAQDGIPPAASYPTLDFRNNHAVLDFDAAADETMYFEGFLPAHYGGGGITVTLAWMATSAISGAVRWAVAVERHEDEGTDLDADSFATANTAGGTAPATSGMVQYTPIAFTSGAQMDSLAAGEHFRLSVMRDADGTSGTDDAAGDAELLGVYITET